jgi:hypothetical protein
MWPPPNRHRFGFDLKSIVTASLAIYAAIVSTATLYLNTLRTTDDLRLSIEDVELSFDQSSKVLSGSANLALVNAGNQTEIVEQADWHARWGQIKKTKECNSERS